MSPNATSLQLSHYFPYGLLTAQIGIISQWLPGLKSLSYSQDDISMMVRSISLAFSSIESHIQQEFGTDILACFPSAISRFTRLENLWIEFLFSRESPELGQNLLILAGLTFRSCSMLKLITFKRGDRSLTPLHTADLIMGK